MNSAQAQERPRRGKLRSVVTPVCLVVVVAGVVIMLVRMEPDTAPDVKVSVTGYANTGAGMINAEFKVSNSSRRPIKVYNTVTIDQATEPGTFIFHHELFVSLAPSVVSIGPGESHKFQVSFASASQWRGVFDLMWDSPGQNFLDWLRIQPWKKYLPKSWLKQKVSRYEFSSRWTETEVNELQPWPPGAPSPFSHISPDPIR
jgi:hypothetical protein